MKFISEDWGLFGMTVASKRKKLEKKVEASKSLKYFDKMRFNVAIKKAFNIKTLKDVEDEIGETIAEREKARKSEQLKRMHATRFPQDYPGGITPFKTEGLESFAKEDYRTKWEKMLDKKLTADVKAKDEEATDEYRNKLIDIIERSTDLNSVEKKEYKSRAKMRGQNLVKLKDEIISGIERKTVEIKKSEEKKLRTEKIANDQYRRDRKKVIGLNEDLGPSDKEHWNKKFNNAKTHEDLIKVRNEYDIFAKIKKKETQKALEAMKGAIERGEDITKGKVEKAGKAEEKKKLVEEIEEAKKKKPEIVKTREPVTIKKPVPTPIPDKKLIPTPTGLVIPSLVGLSKIRKMLDKTVEEDPYLKQEDKDWYYKIRETLDDKKLLTRVGIRINTRREEADKPSRVLPLAAAPIISTKLPPTGKYIDVKKTDIVSERYTELLFKDPKATELDRKRWAQFKQVNMELAKKVKPRKIAEEHYEKLVKLKSGDLDLADKSYEKYLRSLNLSDTVIAYERKKERDLYEKTMKAPGKEELIKRRISEGKFETTTGKIVEISPKVFDARKLDQIARVRIGTRIGITKSGKEVSLDKLPVREVEGISLMDVKVGMARTDTGRSIRIDPKIWNKYRKEDKIEKYEISTRLGITKSGKKVPLTVKPMDAVRLRPDYPSPVKEREARMRAGREKAYWLAKNRFIKERKGKDPSYIGLSNILPGEKEVLADNIPKDKIDAWINLNVGPDHYHMYQWREFRVIPKNVAETLLRRSKKEEWRKEMEPKKVLTAIERDAKTKMEIQRRKAEAVKDLTPEQIRKPAGKMVRVPVMKKDEAGVMRKVKEKVVVGDPKLRQIGVVRRAEIKPLTEQEMARIRETGVRQRQILMEEAQLYQDKLRAQKFLASAFKGKIKPFPKKGYSTYRIVEAYRKRKPMWRLRIRRDHHRDEVHMKFVCTNDYLRGRDEVTREVQKVLTLMNMRMTPDATIRDVTPPRVGPKYRWINIAVKAKKIGEGEIRPR